MQINPVNPNRKLVWNIMKFSMCVVKELMLKCYFSLDFLRKVYTILSLQIIITTAVSAVFMLCNPIKNFVHER